MCTKLFAIEAVFMTLCHTITGVCFFIHSIDSTSWWYVLPHVRKVTQSLCASCHFTKAEREEVMQKYGKKNTLCGLSVYQLST